MQTSFLTFQTVVFESEWKDEPHEDLTTHHFSDCKKKTFTETTKDKKRETESHLEVSDKQIHTHSRCTSHRTTSPSGGSCGCWTERHKVARQQIHWATRPPAGEDTTNQIKAAVWNCSHSTAQVKSGASPRDSCKKCKSGGSISLKK